MGKKAHNPRSGSMAYWPRVRASRIVARIRSHAHPKELRISGFAGVKAGMTQVTYQETKKTARFAGEAVVIPATVLECPPLKIFAVRLYARDAYGLKVFRDIVNPKLDKEVARTVIVPKKPASLDALDLASCAELRILAYTQPHLTGMGQKRPHIFELALGGSSVEEQLAFVKERLETGFSVADVLKEGEYIDVCSVTTGKGVAGPVKRFGIARKQHKSEKGTRRPGSISGGWKAQGHMMYRVPQAGKMGFHARTAYNLKILRISDNPSTINIPGDFLHYGTVKSAYVLVRGSVPGPKKRLVRIEFARRPRRLQTSAPLPISAVSQLSQQ